MIKKYFEIIILGMMFAPIAQAQEYTDAEVYQTGLQLVQDKYLNYQAQDMEKIAINGLKALHQMDKNLAIADDSKRITLYYRGRVVRSNLKPEDRQDVKAWSKLNETMVKAAQKVSKEVNKRDFEVLDTVLENGINQSLDGVSKYYPEGQSDAAVEKGVVKSFTSGIQGNILYIKIAAFNRYTVKNLEEALTENPDYKGIILDLRSSVGGELAAALKVADMFLAGGIMILESKPDGGFSYYHADEEDKSEDKPLVVLIDGKTTSSAELVASALQSQSRGKLVGTTTFGKGSKQELYELPNGAVIGLTQGYFYTAGEEELNKKGVSPDICTYAKDEVADMEKFVNQNTREHCQRQGREKQGFDEEIAKYIIDSQL